MKKFALALLGLILLFEFGNVSAGCYNNTRRQESQDNVQCAELPVDQSEQQLTLQLYCRETQDNGILVKTGDDSAMKEGKFNPKNPVVIVAPGWITPPTVYWALNLKDAWLTLDDVNYFVVDWRHCSMVVHYLKAIDCLPKAGKELAKFITYLHKKGVSLSQIHLLGHSLGSHFMAEVANHGVNVGRMTGLDPAGPFFASTSARGRLDSTDADFVDVIHTNIGMLGIVANVGDLDFYVHGGKHQPSCVNPLLPFMEFLCSHDYAAIYFMNTLKNATIYPAQKCKTTKRAIKGIGCKPTTTYMGIDADLGKPGIYYVQVGNDPPTDSGLQVSIEI